MKGLLINNYFASLPLVKYAVKAIPASAMKSLGSTLFRKVSAITATAINRNTTPLIEPKFFNVI